MERVSVRLPAELLSDIDAEVEEGAFHNRSAAIRHHLRNSVDRRTALGKRVVAMPDGGSIEATGETPATVFVPDGITVGDVSEIVDEVIVTPWSKSHQNKVHLSASCDRSQLAADATPKDPAVLFDDTGVCKYCLAAWFPERTLRRLAEEGEHQ